MTCGKCIWSSKWEVPTEKYVDELFEFDAERMSQVEQHCWINPKPIWNGMGWILMCHWDGWMDWWAPRPCGWPLHKCGQATGPWLGWLEIIIAIIAQWRWMIWPGKYRLFQGGYPGFAPTTQALETPPFDVFWSFPITNTTLGSFMRFKWIVRLSWWPTRWRSGLLDFGRFESFFGWFWMCFLDTNHPMLCFRATVLPCWPPPATTWGATTRRHGAGVNCPMSRPFLVISGRSENSMVPWAIWDELSNWRHLDSWSCEPM